MRDEASLGEFVFPVRVYYEDTDAMGIVYYANYLRFAERARSEMIRGFGFSNMALLAEPGIAVAVRRASADFLAPARLDELLHVYSRVTGVRAASIDMRQIIKRDQVDLVRMDFKLACMTPAGRPARLPSAVRAALAELAIA